MAFTIKDPETERLARRLADITEVLDFWFADGMAARWFESDPAFDAEVREKLGEVHEQAARGALDGWQESGAGAVALCILLDQVPRNMFRGNPRAFATDPNALDVTRHAIEHGLDRDLPQIQRVFLYLPLEHSEDLRDQHECCRLMEQLDEQPKVQDYARQHRDVIARFGRFPHRNAILGRESTTEEQAFLEQPGSSF